MIDDDVRVSRVPGEAVVGGAEAVVGASILRCQVSDFQAASGSVDLGGFGGFWVVLVLVVFCGFWVLKGFGGFRGVLGGFGGSWWF